MSSADNFFSVFESMRGGNMNSSGSLSRYRLTGATLLRRASHSIEPPANSFSDFPGSEEVLLPTLSSETNTDHRRSLVPGLFDRTIFPSRELLLLPGLFDSALFNTQLLPELERAISRGITSFTDF